MKNVNALSRAALRLYKNEGGSYFDIDDITDFMEQEVENCDGEEVSDEEIIRNVVKQMMELES